MKYGEKKPRSNIKSHTSLPKRVEQKLAKNSQRYKTTPAQPSCSLAPSLSAACHDGCANLCANQIFTDRVFFVLFVAFLLVGH